MRKREKLRLIKLYLAYHLNKSFLIIIGLLSILLIIVLCVNLGLPLNKAEYLENTAFYHINYLDQSIYIINIVNSVIIAALIGNEINSISSFDPMFISHIKRSKLISSKIITNIILILFIFLFEFCLMYLLGVIFYSNFVFTIKDLLIFGYLMLYFIQLILIGELLSIIINNFFVTIFIFLFSFIVNILSKIENLKKYIYMFFPFIEINSINNYKLNLNVPIFLIFNILCYLIILILFEKKDIC